MRELSKSSSDASEWKRGRGKVMTEAGRHLATESGLRRARSDVAQNDLASSTEAHPALPADEEARKQLSKDDSL